MLAAAVQHGRACAGSVSVAEATDLVQVFSARAIWSLSSVTVGQYQAPMS